MSEEFTHDIMARASYDHRETEDGPASRGADNMVLSFILRGPLGAISFDLGTGWMAHPLTRPFDWSRPKPWKRSDSPGRDYDIDQHFHDPQTRGCYSHSPTKDRDYWTGPGECNILGGPCYGDGGYMASDKVFAAMVEEGSDGLWREMRQLYDSWLGPEKGTS